jgi:anti-sigma factor RsiW
VEVAVDCRELETLIDRYLDQELEAAESASVRDHLEACSSCRRFFAARESLARLVRQAPYYTAPAGLKGRLTRSRASTSPWLSYRLTWAAAVLLIALLAGSMLVGRWSARTLSSVDAVAEAVVDSHVRALMADHLFDVRSTDQHTVKPWFLGKLDFAPPVADLAPLGFPLTGARLDYVAGRPAAALVYTRGQHTINVFIWPEESANVRPSDTRSIRGFHVRHWVRAGMSFWAVSDLNDAELDQFARALQA